MKRLKKTYSYRDFGKDTCTYKSKPQAVDGFKVTGIHYKESG